MLGRLHPVPLLLARRQEGELRRRPPSRVILGRSAARGPESLGPRTPLAHAASKVLRVKPEHDPLKTSVLKPGSGLWVRAPRARYEFTRGRRLRGHEDRARGEVAPGKIQAAPLDPHLRGDAEAASPLPPPNSPLGPALKTAYYPARKSEPAKQKPTIFTHPPNRAHNPRRRLPWRAADHCSRARRRCVSSVEHSASSLIS